MASWTPEQNAYLSCLLNDVTGTEEVVQIRKELCRIVDCIYSCNSRKVNIYYTGSKAEGVDLPGSDDDYMFDYNNLLDICVSESMQELMQSSRTNKFLAVTENVKPGFIRLTPFNQLRSSFLRRSLLTMDDSTYLSSQLYVSSFYNTLNRFFPNSRIQGPSMEIWNRYQDLSESGDDNVNSIHCQFWPSLAAEWNIRPRRYGWPTLQEKEKIVEFGCHVVPIGHPLSSSKSVEWRLSFSIAEKILVWSFNHTQMQCYATMKLILKEYIKRKCTEEHKGVLCSYFIKTFLFWQYEATNQSFWQTTSFTECLTYLFHEFTSCIQNGVLRHYFIPRFNLLEIKLTPDAQTELLQHFRVLIQGGVSMLAQCVSLSGAWSKFCQGGELMETEVRMRKILKISKYDNDYCLIRKLQQKGLPILLTGGPTIEHGLVALHRAQQDRFSSLQLLAIKWLCLFINIKRFERFSQGNKAKYNCVKAFNKNIFGTDIASSKLWLATFLLQQGDYSSSLQNINDVLSSIPPYALYFGCTKADDHYKLMYREAYSEVNIIRRAKEAWLFDIFITKRDKPFVPCAIQIEIDTSDPIPTIYNLPKMSISPFTYAYYLMFLCYHELRQYDNRDRALRQLVATLDDGSRCSVEIHHSYNVVGHCLLMAQDMETARKMFLLSAYFTRNKEHPLIDKHNAAYCYLSCM